MQVSLYHKQVMLLACIFTLGAVTAGCSRQKEEQVEVSKASEGQLLSVTYETEDMDDTWDASSATKIALSDTSAQIDGEGAAASDGVITVSAAGTYVISGSLTDGQIVVDAGKEDLVRLVLNGAKIQSTTSAAISGVQSQKVVLILAEGTENSVSDA